MTMRFLLLVTMVQVYLTLNIERLFQPFTQGDTARGTEGSGLGLAIIKRIVDTHGGKVELSNKPLGGLQAKVYLPLVF